ncbi:MAG: glycosyltransferase family 2 protein [Methylacidiphilales bacterium]|nr:glycosyltransferase family 2 protein [Candidatus Methylacidiphilales bacterium]
MQLILIIPIYNEATAIPLVIEEWHQALSKALPADSYRILVIDDGSKDRTPDVLRDLQTKYPELLVHTQKNQGHGRACLTGYKKAEEMGAEYVMQIDSDGQCNAVYFPQFWERRKESPLYGRRYERLDGMGRKIISLTLRFCLYVITGTKLHDTNVPYRLYPVKMVAEAAQQIPPTFDLANIAVALYLEPEGFHEIPIDFRDRVGGEPSIRWFGFARKAIRLFRDIGTLNLKRR